MVQLTPNIEDQEAYESDKTGGQCEFRINVIDNGDPLMSCPKNIVISVNEDEGEGDRKTLQETYFAYGGDFGDSPHDANFNINGTCIHSVATYLASSLFWYSSNFMPFMLLLASHT